MRAHHCNCQAEEWMRDLHEDQMLLPHFTVFFVPTKADLCPAVRTFCTVLSCLRPSLHDMT